MIGRQVRGSCQIGAILNSPRHGLTLVEILMILAMTGCIIVGFQMASILKPNADGGLPTLPSLDRDEPTALTEVAIAPNQQDLVVVGLDGTLRVHDLGTRNCLSENRNPHSATRSVAYSPDGAHMLVTSVSGYLDLWSSASSTVTTKGRQAHENDVSCCVFAPDGQRFLTCGDDHRCILWDTHTLEPVFELPGVTETVRRACFSKDGTRLLTGDVTGCVNIWSLQTRQLVQTIRVSVGARLIHASVEGLSLLPGEKEILVATRGGQLGVWNLKSGKPVRFLENQGRPVVSLSLFSDGTRAIGGSTEGQIDIWDLSTGQRLQTLMGHVGPVRGVAVTADQKLAVSAGWDGQLKFWEI